MSKVSTSYASYMTHFHKFDHRIDTFNTAFKHVISLIIDGQFIDCNLENNLQDYPKYPTIYNFFNNTSVFDMWKINNVTLDTVELLKEYINNSDVLQLKLLMDKIPDEIIKIKNDIYLQYSFMADVDDIFDRKQHFHNFNNLKIQTNYFNSLNAVPYNSHFEQDSSSFIHTFLFDYIFRYLLKSTTNIASVTHRYAIDKDIINNDILKNTFNLAIDNLKVEFFNMTSKTILQSLYQMNNIDDSLIDDISKDLQEELPTLKTAFSEYIDTSSYNQPGTIFDYFLNTLYLSVSSDIISDISDNSNIFNQEYIQQLAISEDDKFESFLNTKSNANIKDYLYVSYFYKFWPIKYVNVLPLIISQYTTDVIKQEDVLVHSIPNFEAIAKFCISDNNLNYQQLSEYFSTKINSEYLIDRLENEKIYEFTYFLYLIEMFDNFMESEYYESFVRSIYNRVFVKLRKTGYVQNEFNWCRCFTLFNLFFKTFFRYQVSSNTQFKGLNTNFQSHMTQVLNNTTGNPDYEFRIDLRESKIRSLCSNIINSNIEKIHGFSENMFTSTLTNEINLDALAYFLRESIS